MYKKILITSLFVLCASLSLSAQEEPVSVREETAKTVTAMEVKGNVSISTNTVISKMKTRIGSPYQENIISDDLKRLYLLGFFSDIKIDTEDYRDGLKVVITVTERPIIEKISFSGIKYLRMNEEKLKDVLKSKETQYLDYPALAEDVLALKKLYEKKGFSQAKIDYNVNVSKETNKASVEFKAVEGIRIRIKDILVEGNKAYPKKRILKVMKTKRAWLLNPGILKEEVLEEDIERIKSFYHKGGFIDVAVDYDTRTDSRRPKKPHLYITIKVREGRKYLVGDITIEGNKDIAKEEILAKLKDCVPGKVFSHEGVKADVANIQSLYFDRGYISNQVQETTSLNPLSEKIDIAYNITENEVSYVNKIRVRGNVKTRDVVIRRELRIKPGERFDGDKLRRSKERLQNLGFFEEVSYDTGDTDVSNKKDLIVEVKETKTGAFSFGGGYSTVDEFLGFFEIEQKNFDWKNFPYFTGAGQDLKFRASLGTVSENFDLSFTNPWIFDYPLSFGFDVYKRSRSRESDIGYGYDEDVTGGDIRFGKELSEYVKASLSYRNDQIEISNVSANATQDLKSEAGENTISSTAFGLAYDSRDNVFDPTRGNVLEGTLEWAGGLFGGDKDFYKLHSQASHYFPMWRGSVLETRGQLGLADAYGDSAKVPIYERFFAGGAYTIRGYHERKVGPIDSVSEDPLGGESMLIGNLEYRYPIFDFLKLATFYDAGNVWSKLSEIGSGGFKSGIGLGMRLKTPIGPLMLDYGIPLNKEPGEDTKGSGRFHFSMRHGF